MNARVIHANIADLGEAKRGLDETIEAPSVTPIMVPPLLAQASHPTRLVCRHGEPHIRVAGQPTSPRSRMRYQGQREAVLIPDIWAGAPAP